MRIGLLITSIGNFGQKGFYNAQEIGLAKELDKLFDEVIVYKAVPLSAEKSKSLIDSCEHTTLYQVPVKSHGINGEWDCSTSSYLQKDGSGDYLEFKDKPSQEKLDKCAKLLKELLAKEGYDVNPKFTVLSHNPYYQHNNTFGVGISIKITKKEVQSSSKTK